MKGNSNQEIQQAYARLIINDDTPQEEDNQTQQLNANSNQSPYNIQQPVTYQAPQYHVQYPIQQLPIYAPTNYAQVQPELAVLNTNDDGSNRVSNKQFALAITFIWAGQMVLDYLLWYVMYLGPFLIFLPFLSIIVAIAIPLNLYQLKEPPKSSTQIILFVIHILASSLSQIGYLILLDSFCGKDHMFDMLIYEIFQLTVMVSAFLYLLIAQSKLNFLVISVISWTLLALVLEYLKVIVWQYYYIPIICCSLISYFLVQALQKVYDGKNKIIKKDHILLAFLQFKVLFYIPWI